MHFVGRQFTGIGGEKRRATKEFKVSGTHTDCVKLAINKVMPRRPDLILSGINHGSDADKRHL